MNKRNLKHAFKKAWEDLKSFWCNLFNKIKNRNNENTKKHPILLCIFNIVLILLAVFACKDSCASLADNEGSVLTVNAEEDADLGYFTNYTALENYFSSDYFVFRQSVALPYMTSYTRFVNDIDTDIKTTFTPIGVPNIEIIYLVEKNITDLASARSFICAFGIPSVSYNGNLRRLVNTITYYPIPIPDLMPTNFSFSWLQDIRVPCIVDSVFSADASLNFNAFGYVEIPMNIFFEPNFELIPIADIRYEFGLRAYLYDSYTASLLPFDTSGNKTNFISCVFNSKNGLSSPFKIGFVMSSNSYVNYSEFGYVDTYGRTFEQGEFGDTFVDCYDFGIIDSSSEFLENGFYAFSVLPSSRFPLYYDYMGTDYAIDFSITNYTPSNSDVASYLDGFGYGYLVGERDGYNVGYGDGITSGGGNAGSYQEGYDAAMSEVENELKPLWVEEAKEEEYQRVLVEDKPLWVEEAKEEEYQRVLVEDKPLWVEEAYQRGYNEGTSFGDSGYNAGYKAGLAYSYDYERPKWVKEAVEEEYQRVLVEDKPLWEEQAYQRGYNDAYDLNADGFNPFQSLSKPINSLLSTPLVTNENGNTMVSIGTLFRVGIGVLLFGVLIKVFLGG